MDDDWNPSELATQVVTGAVVDLLQRRLRSFPPEDAVLAAAGRSRFN